MIEKNFMRADQVPPQLRHCLDDGDDTCEENTCDEEPTASTSKFQPIKPNNKRPAPLNISPPILPKRTISISTNELAQQEKDKDVSILMVNMLQKQMKDDSHLTATEKRCKAFCDSQFYNMLAMPLQSLPLFQAACIQVQNKYLSSPEPGPVPTALYSSVGENQYVELIETPVEIVHHNLPEDMTINSAQNTQISQVSQVIQTSKHQPIPRMKVQKVMSLDSQVAKLDAAITNSYQHFVQGDPISTSTQINIVDPDAETQGDFFVAKSIPKLNSAASIDLVSGNLDDRQSPAGSGINLYYGDECDLPDDQPAYTDTEDTSMSMSNSGY